MIIPVFILASFLYQPIHRWDDSKWDYFLDRIQTLETGQRANPNYAVGDGGAALGTMQLHRGYVEDAQQYDKSLRGLSYNKISTDNDLSRQTVRAYMLRYWRPGMTMHDMARMHNGGPNGHKKQATRFYLKKFIEITGRVWE